MSEDRHPGDGRNYEVEVFPNGDGYISVSFQVGSHSTNHLKRIEKIIESAAEVFSNLLAKTMDAHNQDPDVQAANLDHLIFLLAENSDILDYQLCEVFYVDDEDEPSDEDETPKSSEPAQIIRLDDYRPHNS